MQTFYVFWRGDEDDFLCTLIDFEEGFDVGGLSNRDWVCMAFDCEYPEESNPFVGDNAAPYDLIEIVGGAPTFHMK